MTGLTENGRSISVVRKVLPANSNLAMAQAAIRPNTRLIETDIAATTRVSRIADSASGSDSAPKYAPIPLEKASANTRTSGNTTNTPRKVRAMAMTAMRTPRGSVRKLSRAAPLEESTALEEGSNEGLGSIDGPDPRTGIADAIRPLPSGAVNRVRCSDVSRLIKQSLLRGYAALRPALQPVDHKDNQERHDQHDHRDRGGVGIAELGEPDHDQERSDLGDVR